MLKRTSALCIVGALTLSACATPENFDPNAPDQNRTQQGALAGAAVGAIAGLASTDEGDKAKGAIIGAALGAGAGALVGQRLDQQEADLRAALGNDQVRIQNTGEELIVTLPQDILFAVDSADLRPDLRRDLGALASNLQAYPDTTVDIIGHTDNTGEAGYNQDLSQRRAQSVSNVLVNNGVAPARLRAFGRGENEPVADNLTAEGRAQNRRVDIIIRPTA